MSTSAQSGSGRSGRSGARSGGGSRGPRRRKQRSAAAAEVRPQTGMKRTLMGTIRQLSSYVRLLVGLLTDPRVATVDKLLVGAAVAYIVSPFDFVVDYIPFIGQVDDVFLLITALQRMISNAGRRVVLDHWTGDVSELTDLNLNRVLTAASFFLPGRLKRRLKMIGR